VLILYKIKRIDSYENDNFVPQYDSYNKPFCPTKNADKCLGNKFYSNKKTNNSKIEK